MAKVVPGAGGAPIVQGAVMGAPVMQQPLGQPVMGAPVMGAQHPRYTKEREERTGERELGNGERSRIVPVARSRDVQVGSQSRSGT